MLALSKRKRVIQGGTSSGKTHGIIPILINTAIDNPYMKITVVAETIPAVKDGAVDIFKSIMLETNRWNDSQWLGSPMQYTFKNRSKIQFKAFDSEGKAKAAGKRDILFLNEANHIDWKIAHALMIRSTGEIWMDYNPDHEFWAHTEILTQTDSEFLLLKYTDNEACPKTTIEDLMQAREKAKHSTYWANWCKVYIDGEIGTLQGVVFQNWKQVDMMPDNASLIGYGLDFGYTNDPTALVAVHFMDNQYYYDELIYQRGLTTPQLATMMLQLGVHDSVFADSADPKAIDELNTYGLNVYPTSKGADSIKQGIQLMQDSDFFITSRSTNLIKEFRRYEWLTDRTGAITNTPVDAWNHGIDAIRYYHLSKYSNKETTYYVG